MGKRPRRPPDASHLDGDGRPDALDTQYCCGDPTTGEACEYLCGDDWLKDQGRWLKCDAWKGHDWDAMNRLYEKGYIGDPRSKAKSVTLSEEGEARSKELFYKLFGKTETSTASRSSGST